MNNQALLLRGKVRSEAGDFDAAAADLTRAAQNAAAPAWVRYQARYQLVVTRLARELIPPQTRSWSFFANLCRTISMRR